MTNEEKEKMLKALEILAYGGTETKTVTQYKRGANGRDAVVGKTVTETHKLPDRSALDKLMEIKGVYINPNAKLKQMKVDEVTEEQDLQSFVDDLAIE